MLKPGNKCFSALLFQRPCIFRLDLAVAGDEAVLWPQVAGDPGYRLERPALGIPRRDNQALVERVRVCGCRWANVVENEHFLAQAAAGHQEGQEGEEQAQERDDTKLL